MRIWKSHSSLVSLINNYFIDSPEPSDMKPLLHILFPLVYSLVCCLVILSTKYIIVVIHASDPVLSTLQYIISYINNEWLIRYICIIFYMLITMFFIEINEGLLKRLIYLILGIIIYFLIFKYNHHLYCDATVPQRVIDDFVNRVQFSREQCIQTALNGPIPVSMWHPSLQFTTVTWKQVLSNPSVFTDTQYSHYLFTRLTGHDGNTFCLCLSRAYPQLNDYDPGSIFQHLCSLRSIKPKL